MITVIENFRAPFYAPFYAAAALRAYEAEGVEVIIKKSSEAAQTISLLMSGYGEVSWGGLTRLMAGVEKNAARKPVAFCEVVGRDPFFLLGHEPNPQFSFADLLGKKLATVTEVPAPWMCLHYDLRLAGIDPNKIDRVSDRTMEENVSAFRAGDVDVIQVFHPFARIIVEDRVGHVWYSAALRGPTCYTTLNCTRQFIEHDADTVLHMCRAMYRTQKWIACHDGRALAEAVSAYFPDIPVEVLGACYDEYKDLGIWSRSPWLSVDSFQWLRSAALSIGRINVCLAYEDCVDMRFAEAVIREDPPSI